MLTPHADVLSLRNKWHPRRRLGGLHAKSGAMTSEKQTGCGLALLAGLLVLGGEEAGEERSGHRKSMEAMAGTSRPTGTADVRVNDIIGSVLPNAERRGSGGAKPSQLVAN
jgi:hypothetical protein